MRITFFGSSHGVPEPNRKCSCAMVEAGGRKYLIDAGTDPVDELVKRGIGISEIRAVFITHLHGDHTDGLVHFLDLLSWYYKEASPAFYVPKTELKEAVKPWLSIQGVELREDLEFSGIREGLFYDDGVLRVTAFRTGHIDVSYAFMLEAEGRKVLFTGDMKHVTGPVDDYARYAETADFDLAVAECAHFDAMLYEAPLRKNPPKLFCFNHYSPRYEESCLHLRESVKDVVPVLMANDGLVIDL